jgi:hypothetical protein
VAEDLHAGIVADRHWPVGLEELVVLPPAEGLEAVEGQVELVPAQLRTGRPISEQVLPEEQLALEAHLLMSVQAQEEGEGAQVAAGRPETPHEVGNADPELVDAAGLELTGNSVGFELGRESALQVGQGEHQVGLSAGLAQGIQVHSYLPLLAALIKCRQHKGLLEVSGAGEAVDEVRPDGSHVPEAGDASHRKGKQAEEEDIGLCHYQ